MTVRKNHTQPPPCPHPVADTTAAETAEPPLWLNRRELPLELSAVPKARRHARQTLRDWGLEADIVENAELIVSELATNAVRHSERPPAGGRFVLTLIHLPETLQIYLADTDPRPPVALRPAEDATGGRGLLLVGELSDRWGIRLPTPDQGTGKAVVAELRLAGPSSGDAAANWDAGGPMPPIPDADPFTRARILTSLRDVVRGGPLVYAQR